MTLLLPLSEDKLPPESPPFLRFTNETNTQLNRLVCSILQAERIVVICGAGVSVHAGIPDFRSAGGLFEKLKKKNPDHALNSGKDLFDVAVFRTESTSSLFCRMIAQLFQLSQQAQPTPFHRLLRALDARGSLLRVYTQNIDCLERKCGLSFGVPDNAAYTRPAQQSAKRKYSSSTEYPRCIPLHGTLETMYCTGQAHSFLLKDHLPALSSGQLPICPECLIVEEKRVNDGKRPHKVTKLRPDVVMYNEDHREGEEISAAVQKDLGLVSRSRSSKEIPVDLVLVAGTSLKIPGANQIVRQFAEKVHRQTSDMSSDEPDLKVVYLNDDFPQQYRQWNGVFDVWVKGDLQKFAEILQEEMDRDCVRVGQSRVLGELQVGSGQKRITRLDYHHIPTQRKRKAEPILPPNLGEENNIPRLNMKPPQGVHRTRKTEERAAEDTSTTHWQGRMPMENKKIKVQNRPVKVSLRPGIMAVPLESLEKPPVILTHSTSAVTDLQLEIANDLPISKTSKPVLCSSNRGDSKEPENTCYAWSLLEPVTRQLQQQIDVDTGWGVDDQLALSVAMSVMQNRSQLPYNRSKYSPFLYQYHAD